MGKTEERIKELEDLISNSQYNKRTQGAIGRYKAQLAKLKEKRDNVGQATSGPEGYGVRKSGDATVALLGFPSVGKSTILNQLTDADSEVGSYSFTTLTVIPGMLKYKYANIQILDVPGIVTGAASGRGRGSEVISVLRSADLVLMVLDVHAPNQIKQIKKEVYDAGLRLNKRRPDVKIVKKSKDGISVGRTVQTPNLNDETVENILKEFRIMNADVVIRSEIGPDEFIDCLEDNKKYVKAIKVINKVDLADEKTKERARQIVEPNLEISAFEGYKMDELKQLIYEKLDLMSIYMKEPGQAADMEEPLIIKTESSVEDVCRKLHQDFVKNFKYCRVWGPSSKFPGQKLGLTHILQEDDVLEIHTR